MEVFEQGAPASALGAWEQARPEEPKDAIEMRFTYNHDGKRANPALQQGATEWVANAAPDRLLTFVRRGQRPEFFVAVSCSRCPFIGAVEIAGAFDDVTPHLRSGPPRGATLPVLSLDAWGFRVFKRR